MAPYDITLATYVRFPKVTFSNRSMQVITLPRKVIMYLRIKSEICHEYFWNITFTDTEHELTDDVSVLILNCMYRKEKKIDWKIFFSIIGYRVPR